MEAATLCGGSCNCRGWRSAVVCDGKAAAAYVWWRLQPYYLLPSMVCDGGGCAWHIARQRVRQVRFGGAEQRGKAELQPDPYCEQYVVID